MNPERAGQENSAVYFDASAVVGNALAVGLAGFAMMLGGAFASQPFAVLKAAACCFGAACLVFSVLRVVAARKWRSYAPVASAPAKAYIGFERTALHLLDEVAIPWSSIAFLKISRLTWPRRAYLLVGLKHALPGGVPATLTEENMLIALAQKEATGKVMEPQSFLALCIEANWSPLAPVALSHDDQEIAGLCAEFFESQPVVDHEAVAALFYDARAAYLSGDAMVARALCIEVLQMDGEHDEAHFMLGLLASASGITQNAEHHLRAALALRERPAYAAALAKLLNQTQHVEEAETWYRLAHTLAPDDAGVLCELANMLKDGGRRDEAEALYLLVVQLDPEGTPALNNLGMLRWKEGRLDEANAYYLRALALDAALPDTHNNLGNVQRELGQFAEAEASYRRALALRPEFAGAHGNLGLLLQETGRQAEAQQNFGIALALEPSNAQVRYNLSLTRLAFGDFERGLPAFEARYDPGSSDSPVKLPSLPMPQWQGEDLSGKSLLVWPEQGLGDYVQFARYFPVLKARGVARLTLCCAGVLAPLLQTAEGVDVVISERTEMGDHDYWTFPMSLALRCDTRIDTIPARLPYLHALPQRLQNWQPALETRKRKIGLVWKGAAGHTNDANRSLPSLEPLAPLWDVADVQFFSLQKGQAEAEAEAAAAGGRLVHLGGRIADLADTAAIVAQLDLVICIDTAIAHIAGALGTRCWVLLPAVGCDWRWHLERADSPWYPDTMRLFRQHTRGDWHDVVAQLRASLTG